MKKSTTLVDEDPFPHLYGKLNLDAITKVYKFIEEVNTKNPNQDSIWKMI